MSSYIKPQSPLYNEAADVYIYPLTTVDQIVLSNGERLNENCFGKGIELNYSIIGGLEEPENPTENMIWVETETEEITDYIFSKNEPKNPIDNMIWICSGESSNVAFHSLNINGRKYDEIFPVSAKQYVGGVWVDKVAKSYQNGEWVEWALFIVKDGDVLVSFTTSGNATLTKEVESIVFYTETTYNATAYVQFGPFNFGEHSQVRLVYDLTTASHSYIGHKIDIYNTSFAQVDTHALASTNATNAIMDFDVSQYYTGEGYIRFNVYYKKSYTGTGDITMTIKEMRLS